MLNYGIPPNALPVGATIVVTDPSNGLASFKLQTIQRAQARLEKLGYRVKFAEGLLEPYAKYDPDAPQLNYDKAVRRVARYNAAVADPAADLVMAALGGSSSNWVLPHLDIVNQVERRVGFQGFSDCAAVCNALAYHGLVGYYGPSFINFADEGMDYSIDMWTRLVLGRRPFDVTLPKEYIDSPKELGPGEKPTFIPFPKWISVQSGEASGVVVGGNIMTFLTMYNFLPSIEGAILMLEGSGGVDDWSLANMTNTILSRGKPAALVFGTLQKSGCPDPLRFIEMVRQMPNLPNDIPVVYGAPFGHVQPRITLPIGGYAEVKTDATESSLILSVVSPQA